MGRGVFLLSTSSVDNSVDGRLREASRAHENALQYALFKF